MDNFKLPKIFDAGGDISHRWYIHYSFRNPKTNKFERFRIFISKSITNRTKRYVKADEIYNDIRRKLLSGFNPYKKQQKVMSLRKALDFVVSYKLASSGKRTAFTYRSVVKLFMQWATKNKIADNQLEIISKNIMQQYLDHCLTIGRVSMRTYNNRLRALKTIFNVLIEREYIDVNPMAGIKQMRQPDAGIIAFNEAELRRIAEILPVYNYQLYVITQLIFYCFLRPAELVRLQFGNIQWENRIILVPGSKSKNGRSESIVMPEQMICNLRDWKLDFPDNWYLFSSYLKPGTKQISPNRISDHWRTFKKVSGIKKNIYSFKHTGNGMAFDLNLNARDIQLQNRHYSLEQTQGYLNKFRRKASDTFIKQFKGY